MKLIVLIVVIQMLSACVLAQGDHPEGEGDPMQRPGENEGTSSPHVQCIDNIPCNNCEERGGKCMDAGSKCCFDKPPIMRCLPTKGICGSNCTQKGGACNPSGQCCFNNTGRERPPMRCLPTKGICGSNCTQKGGVCNPSGQCCFNNTGRARPPMRCLPTKGICGSNCTQKGGACNPSGQCCFNITGTGQGDRPEGVWGPMQRPGENEGMSSPRVQCIDNIPCNNCEERGGKCMDAGSKCCFDKRPTIRCLPTKGICGSNCTKKGGVCNPSGQCCFNITDGEPDDKGRHDNIKDDGDRDQGERPRTDGDYKEYDGRRLRCTKSKCSSKREKTYCKRRKGICFDGRCCYKPTQNEAHSQCELKRRHLLAESERKGKMAVEQMNCSSTGAYLAKCSVKEKRCHCLNASSGEPVGKSMRVVSKDKINCDDVQKQTRPEYINVTTKLSTKPFDTFRKEHLDDLARQIKPTVESLVPATVVNARTFAGSLMVEFQLKECASNCAATANTSDLYSISLALVDQIKQGNLVLEVDGEEMVASEAVITHITTTEALQAGNTPLHREENKTEMTVIIAVVVAAVVIIMLSIGAACYFYNRANKAKAKAAFFSDITGQENPTYFKA